MESKNLPILWITGILSATFAFITQSIIARELDLNSYGELSAILAMSALIAPMAGFGACKLILKVFGENKKKGRQKYIEIMVYIIISTLLATLSYIIIVNPIKDDEVWKLMFSLYAMGVISVELLITNNQINQNWKSVGIWQFLPNTLRCFAIITLLIINELSLVNAASVYLMVSLFCIFFSLKNTLSFSKKCKQIEVEEKNNISHPIIKVLKESWPYGLASVMHLIIYQGDIIILGYLDRKEVVALYNTSFLIISVVYLMPAIAYQKLYLPLIHKWSYHEREKLGIFFKWHIKLNIAAGILVGYVMWIGADVIIGVAFGSKYEDAGKILRMLALSIPFMFIIFASGPILSTKNNIWKKIKLMSVIAGLNIIMNILLIPYFSFYGACASTVISAIIMAYLYYKSAYQIVQEN